MEWEELITREDDDDAVTVIWMKNLAGSYWVQCWDVPLVALTQNEHSAPIQLI
jgi:hypothetical protein